MPRSWRGASPISLAAAGPRSRSLDVVSRYWLSTLVSAQETSLQVEVAFIDALSVNGSRKLTPSRQVKSDPLVSSSLR